MTVGNQVGVTRLSFDPVGPHEWLASVEGVLDAE